MILICGATGTIGSRVTKLLAARGVAGRALMRSADSSRIPAGVKPVVGDLGEPNSLSAALQGVDKVFLLSANGPRQEQMENNMIDAAAKAGVQQVVKLSVMGSGPEAASEFGRLHARVEARLASSGLEWTVLRPNMMMQNLFWYRQSIAQGVLPLALGAATVSHVDAEDVAAVAVEALTGGKHHGQTYTLTGPEALTCDEVAGVLTVALGIAVRYQAVSMNDFRTFLAGAGEAPSTVDAEIELFEAWSQGAGSQVTSTVTDLLHRPALTLAEFARNNAPVFSA